MKTDVVRVTELVIKYLRKELSETERTELSAWLGESAGNKRIFDELTNEEGLIQELRKTLEPGMEASVKEFMAMRKAAKSQLINRLFRLSATVGFTLGALLLALPGGISITLNKTIGTAIDLQG